MDLSTAMPSIQCIAGSYQLLKDERGIFGHWQNLIAEHRILGKTGHDARLVAAMMRHGVTSLLTFNVQDFARFSTIQVFSPAEFVMNRRPS